MSLSQQELDKAWEGDSGGFQKYQFDIHHAEFCYTENSVKDGKEGKMLFAHFVGELRTEDGHVQDWTKDYSVGYDWEPANGGTSCIHETGSATRNLWAMCNFMKFVGSAVKAGVPIRERITGRPTDDITGWAGLSLAIEKIGEEYDSREKDAEGNPVKKTFTQDMPVGLVGTFEPKQLETVSQGNGSSNGATNLTDDELLELANGAEGNYFNFVTAARQKGLNATDPRVSKSGPIWSLISA